MTDNKKLIRLTDGTMIVGMVEGLDNLEEQKFIEVSYPIEIFSDGVSDMGDSFSEQFMLKAWMGLSDDVMFKVNTGDITSMGSLKQEYIKGYENVVDRMFFRDEEEQHSANEEFGPEDLLELLQAKQDNKLN